MVANSSYSTQQFYRSIDCVPATEHIAHLCDAEPYDIQMEYDLEGELQCQIIR